MSNRQEDECIARVKSLFSSRAMSGGELHDSLEKAAEILGSLPHEIRGPNLIFRWIVDQTVVDISPKYDYPRGAKGDSEIKCAASVASLDHEEASEEDYELIKYWSLYEGDEGDADSYYAYEAPLCWILNPQDEQDQIPLYFGESIWTWKGFEYTFGRMLQEFPKCMALTPPAWRAKIFGQDVIPLYRWNMGEQSPWETVVFSSSPEGLSMSCTPRRVSQDTSVIESNDTTQPQVTVIPRRLLDRRFVSMTEVIIGLANHTAVIDLDFTSLLEVGRNILILPSFYRRGEDPDFEQEFESMFKDTQGVSRSGMSLDELRAVIAENSV